MDYENKYKEALEKARQLCAYPTTKPFISDLQDLFPELAESEDERVRKFLIGYFGELVDENSEWGLTKETRDKILAWLEKQNHDGKKWIYEDVYLKEKEQLIQDGIDEVLENPQKYGLEKQGEQKPQRMISAEAKEALFDYENANIQQKDFAPKIEPKFKVKYAGSEYNVLEVKDIAGVSFYGIEDEPNHIDYVKAENCEIISGYAIKENGSPYPTKPAVFSEQKPVVWSEEDEHFRLMTLGALVTCKTKFPTNNVDEQIRWIKSLKDRFIPQPKQEWSEEDEDNFKHLMDEIVCLGNNRNSANRLYYDRLIKFIKELKNRAQPKEKWCDKDERMLDRLIAYFEKQVAFTDDDNLRYANWLKSLRPQNTWKPSEEQLNNILDVLSFDNCTPKRRELLESLYEQLKKL